MATNTDHIIMDLNNSQMVCRHCHGAFQITFPIPISKWCKQIDAFIALHKDCKVAGESQ